MCLTTGLSFKIHEARIDRTRRFDGKATIIIRALNVHASIMYRRGRQKIGKDLEILNHTINHLALIDIYGTLHQTVVECIPPSSSPWDICQGGHTTHIMSCKTSLTNLKGFKLYRSMTRKLN